MYGQRFFDSLAKDKAVDASRSVHILCAVFATTSGFAAFTTRTAHRSDEHALFALSILFEVFCSPALADLKPVTDETRKNLVKSLPALRNFGLNAAAEYLEQFANGTLPED